MSRRTDALDRADVGDDRARLQMRRDLLRDRAAGADRNADDDEIGAFDRRRVGLDHLIGNAQARRRARRVAAERAVATIERTAPCARAARAIEEPIRPMPISASRLNKRLRRSCAGSRHEFRERRDRRAGWPLRCRPSCAAHSAGDRLVDAAQDQAALGQKRVGVRRRPALRGRKVDQHEIGDARRHLEPELADFLVQPGKPLLVVRARGLDMRAILDARRCRPRRRPN